MFEHIVYVKETYFCYGSTFLDSLSFYEKKNSSHIRQFGDGLLVKPSFLHRLVILQRKATFFVDAMLSTCAVELAMHLQSSMPKSLRQMNKKRVPTHSAVQVCHRHASLRHANDQQRKVARKAEVTKLKKKPTPKASKVQCA